MKLSVSLPSEDVEFLDSYAEELGGTSRSAALHRAIDLLRSSRLGEAYADAWDEWEQSDEGESIWGPAAGDGLTA